MHITLEIIAGPDSGQSCRVLQFPFVIGRHSQCNLVLSDLAVSRRHAVLRAENGQVLLEDLQSRQGTRLGNQRIMRQVLPVGISEVDLASTRLRVRLEPPKSQPADADATAETPLLRPFAGGAQFTARNVGERAVLYESVGPHPPVGQLAIALAHLRPALLAVDVAARDLLDPDQFATAPKLCDWLADDVTDTTSPRLLPLPGDVTLFEGLADADASIIYVGDSQEDIARRLRTLARLRESPEDSPHAPVILPLARPSLIRDFIAFGGADMADKILDGLRAVLMEGKTPDSWCALGTSSLQAPLAHFGYQNASPPADANPPS
jgi:pSer/pThr/pTyr-binding forkhead associated (FHA) protein